MWGNLWNIFEACNILKNTGLSHVLFCDILWPLSKIFDLFQNPFSPFQQVYLYNSNSSVPVIGKSNKGTLSM